MITLSHYHKDVKGELISTVNYSVHSDLNIDDLMQEIRYFLLACSFDPELIDQYIKAE